MKKRDILDAIEDKRELVWVSRHGRPQAVTAHGYGYRWLGYRQGPGNVEPVKSDNALDRLDVWVTTLSGQHHLVQPKDLLDEPLREHEAKLDALATERAAERERKRAVRDASQARAERLIEFLGCGRTQGGYMDGRVSVLLTEADVDWLLSLLDNVMERS
jgi:hypothetical protein